VELRYENVLKSDSQFATSAINDHGDHIDAITASKRPKQKMR